MIRNVSFSFIGQGLGILASFIVRNVFILHVDVQFSEHNLKRLSFLHCILLSLL